MKDNYQKLKRHLETRGLLYAFWRGIKYIHFLAKKRASAAEEAGATLIKGNIKIICTCCGINIYWNEIEATTGIGLNVAINTLGLWTYSTKADWKILEKGRHSLKVEVVFKELPLAQVWKIKINDEDKIEWDIDMKTEVPLHIDECRIVCLVDPRYKTWVSDYQHGDFPRLDNKFHDLYQHNCPVSLVGARFSLGDEFLPSFALETKNTDLLPLIQNSSIDAASHIIGLRAMLSRGEGSYPPGCHSFFNGRINLSEKDSELDSRIEKFRQISLRRVFDEKTKKIAIRRKLKILLANLPWQREGIWGVRAGSRWPHIRDFDERDYLPFVFFLAYAFSLLQKRNIDAVIIDAIAERIKEDKFLKIISKGKFDYLVAETSIPSFYDDLRILKKISALGIPVILCGPNCEIYQPQFLEKTPFITFVLYGEYEFTLLELIKCLQEGRSLSEVKGLIYRDNGRVIKNPQREPLDVNLLPWPHRDSLPMYKYLDAPGGMCTPSAQIMASRGCPFKCQFCLWPQVFYQGSHYRPRDVNDVVSEMEYLVKEKGFKSVYFDDDTFNIGKKRMLEFCRRVRVRGLDRTQWAIMARPDLMDEEILMEMKSAGLWAVKYGVESATQALVDNIEKGMDLRKAEEMIRFTKKLGIKTHLTFTFGLPGETEQTIEKTIQLALELDPFSLQFSIMTPFLGTKYYNILEEKKQIVSKDFSCYDGNYKSVIKLENLTPQDLEIARKRACDVWAGHLKIRPGTPRKLKKFYDYTKQRGLGYSLSKTAGYLKGVSSKRQERSLFVEASRRIGSSGTGSEGLTRDSSRSVGVLEPLNSNSADIILIQSPPWDVAMPPLGVGYLTNYLKKQGYKVAVFDLNITLNNLAKEDTKYLWDQKSYDWWVDGDLFKGAWSQLKSSTIASLNEVIKKIDTKCIGLSVNFAGIQFAAEIIKIIKHIKNEMKIIVGGWGCINDHMRNLFPRELIDAFVVGEGEETLKEVLEVLEGRRSAGDVRGAVFNKNGQVAYMPRANITNLDNIPWPTFSEFLLSRYQSRTLPLFTSRGCVGCCSFCNDWVISRPHRFRSAENIFEEIKYHAEKNHITNFSFKDLLCNGNIDELRTLSNLIYNSKLHIGWDSQAITRKEMTYELLRDLRKGGCRTLIYGIESFSNNVLKQMKKIFTAEIAEKVLSDTHKAGIKTIVNIIVGFPGEAEEDYRETLRAIERNREHIAQIGAISVCLINNDCDLERDFQRYELVLSDNPKIRAKEWSSADGKNTYKVRRQRAEGVLELVNKLNLTYETRTI